MGKIHGIRELITLKKDLVSRDICNKRAFKVSVINIKGKIILLH